MATHYIKIGLAGNEFHIPLTSPLKFDVTFADQSVANISYDGHMILVQSSLASAPAGFTFESDPPPVDPPSWMPSPAARASRAGATSTPPPKDPPGAAKQTAKAPSGPPPADPPSK
jgi:hypothetical protein